MEANRSSVGRGWSELETPALLLDLEALERNVEAMAEQARDLGVALRPHVKTHKSPDLAWLQLAAGAAGLTTATVAEAEAMVRAGHADVFVANEVVQPVQIAALAELAGRAAVSVLVDDEQNLAGLAAAAVAAGSQIDVIVDVDTGMERCGVRDPEAARRLAERVDESAGARFAGVSGYEGHCQAIVDRKQRTAAAREAMAVLAETVAALQGDGIVVPLVSAGGTGTYEVAGAEPFVTEVQPGGYVLMDAAHARITAAFEPAVTVAASVLSRQGSQAVLDCGQKAAAALGALPSLPPSVGRVEFVDEEHLGLADVRGELRPGDKLRVVPGYAPLTVNLYDRFHVLRGETVVDEWPVVARYGDRGRAAG